MKTKEKRLKRFWRHKRIRNRIKGTGRRPRLSLFRSNRHIWVQLIDDEKGITLLSASDLEVRGKYKEKKEVTRIAIARSIGELIGKKAVERDIHEAVFDRGGYKYHGLVKAVAEGARSGGLKI